LDNRDYQKALGEQMKTDPNLGIVTITLMISAALAAQFGDDNEERRKEQKREEGRNKMKILQNLGINIPMLLVVFFTL
jgi:hypothetical protein